MKQNRSKTALFAFFLLANLAVGIVDTRAQAEAPARRVVFVCDHGSVKSLMASLFFDRMAADRGLPYRSVSRGVSPDPVVPPKIAAALHAEGFDVANYKPVPLGKLDLDGASRVVSIGVDAANAGVLMHDRPVDSWTDVPAASVDFAASKAALVRHIEALLDELAGVN